MVLIDSIYINNGGGVVLLRYLIEELRKSNLDYFLLLDKRTKNEFSNLMLDKVEFLPASIIYRHLFYLKNRHRFSKILCFSNIPPSCKTQAEVYTYFHNLALFEADSDVPLIKRTLIQLKLTFIRIFAKNTNWYIVQSAYVKDVFVRHFSFLKQRIKIIPFFKPIEIAEIYPLSVKKDKNFIFVSDGHSHKNHVTLLKAWALVNKKDPSLKLFLTISNQYSNLIKEIAKSNLNIENLGYISQKELHQYYFSCKFLIYPSLVESFGLGLIEATEFGCEVIAADRPYVFEIVKPFAVFDPLNPNDIAETVLYALHEKNDNIKTQVRVKNEIKTLIRLLED